MTTEFVRVYSVGRNRGCRVSSSQEDILAETRPNMHFVCTRAEAAALIEAAEEYWIGVCGCRKGRGGCDKSGMDVCLEFRESTAAEGDGRRKVGRADALELLELAEEKHLVTRPFRDESRTRVDGICFCCDCCCEYSHGGDDGGYACDRGSQVEQTDMDVCTDCGECVDVCFFGARMMDGAGLRVRTEECFGCGLCVDVCPVECIRMVSRR